MNDELTTRLTRQLHAQVDDWSTAPLTLDDVRGRASIVIPPEGLEGLVVNLAQLPSGIYTVEVQVVDAYENESDVLEYLITVGQPASAPKVSVQMLTANGVKISWPASASDYTLEANTALSAIGWTAIPASQVGTEGANKSFTDTVAGPTRFYRLRKN